jgi:hypothetical protein
MERAVIYTPVYRQSQTGIVVRPIDAGKLHTDIQQADSLKVHRLSAITVIECETSQGTQTIVLQNKDCQIAIEMGGDKNAVLFFGILENVQQEALPSSGGAQLRVAQPAQVGTAASGKLLPSLAGKPARLIGLLSEKPLPVGNICRVLNWSPEEVAALISDNQEMCSQYGMTLHLPNDEQQRTRAPLIEVNGQHYGAISIAAQA